MTHPIAKLMEQAIYTLELAQKTLPFQNENTPGSLPKSLEMTIEMLRAQIDMIASLEKMAAHKEQTAKLEKVFPSKDLGALTRSLEELQKLSPEDPDFIKKLQAITKLK